MKVIKINKHFRNGCQELFLVLLEEHYAEDDIEYEVECCCETTPEGANYGYRYDWEFVEDAELIKTVLQNKVNSLNKSIERLTAEKLEIEKYL